MLVWRNGNIEKSVSMLVELLFLRSGTFSFSSPEFALQDVKSMIECVACH